MAVPDFQTLQKPVLEKAALGEQKISNVVAQLADELDLSKEDREELLPSGKQTRFANRVHWARSYLKQAGLIKNTKRAHFIITDRGRDLLSTHDGMITKEDLRKYDDFLDFESRTNTSLSLIHI